MGSKTRHILNGRESQTEMKTRLQVMLKEGNPHIDNRAIAALGKFFSYLSPTEGIADIFSLLVSNSHTQ